MAHANEPWYVKRVLCQPLAGAGLPSENEL